MCLTDNSSTFWAHILINTCTGTQIWSHWWAEEKGVYNDTKNTSAEQEEKEKHFISRAVGWAHHFSQVCMYVDN